MFNKYSFVSTKSAMYDIFRRYLNIKISLRPIARGRKVDAVASARRRRVDARQTRGRRSTDAPQAPAPAHRTQNARVLDAVFVKLFLGSSSFSRLYCLSPVRNLSPDLNWNFESARSLMLPCNSESVKQFQLG